MLNAKSEARSRALLSLEGLAIGDSFGERFFFHENLAPYLIAEQALPAPIWRFTDDTRMALSIVAILAEHDGIDQEALASHFATLYTAEPQRGYGPSMHTLLPEIQRGIPWRDATARLFAGKGSFGNGAAMRVAPLGGYFADDMDRVVTEAHRSAEITHAHPEGIAGAIAVAVMAAIVWQTRRRAAEYSGEDLIKMILPYIPASEVRRPAA